MPGVPTFHDFDLVDVTLGPRREVRLQLRDGLGGTSCVVRFAAIDDFARGGAVRIVTAKPPTITPLGTA